MTSLSILMLIVAGGAYGEYYSTTTTVHQSSSDTADIIIQPTTKSTDIVVSTDRYFNSYDPYKYGNAPCRRCPNNRANANPYNPYNPTPTKSPYPSYVFKFNPGTFGKK